MIALDVLLLIMITVCIVYCWILNRRIQDLHNSRVEFARMIKEFDAAIVKADKASTEMRELSSVNHNQITAVQEVLKNGENTYQELSVITDMGKNIADRLENSISKARKLERIFVESTNEQIDIVDTKKQANNDIKDVRMDHSSNIFDDSDNDGILQSSIDQRTMSPDEALALHHKNELKYALQRIARGGEGTLESNHLNQSGYFDTLKKVNTRK